MNREIQHDDDDETMTTPVAELPTVAEVENEEEDLVTETEETGYFEVEVCPHCGRVEDECDCYDYDWGEAQEGDFPAEEEDEYDDREDDDFLASEIESMKLDGTYYLLAMSGY